MSEIYGIGALALKRANDSFAGSLGRDALANMESEVAGCIADLLAALRIEPDHNTRDTPDRVARMMVREVFSGRYDAPPVVTDFPNLGADLDQIYAVGPVAFRSTCAHHLVPIMGQAWVGVVPSGRVIGLSKFHRLTGWIMSRPQIQEEATEQLADALSEAMQPRGLALVLRAKHMCCGWRGVRDDGSLMTTSIMRGICKEDSKARLEFMSLIAGMGYG
jgi:GTP cyclohydrolase I